MLTLEPVLDIDAVKDVIAIDEKTFKACQKSPDEILNQVIRPDYRIYLAREEGQAVGYMALMSVCTLHYTACWVDLIAVVPECQSQGIAQEMLVFAEADCKDRKAQFISALVRNTNVSSLLAFKRSGYAPEKDPFQLMIRDI